MKTRRRGKTILPMAMILFLPLLLDGPPVEASWWKLLRRSAASAPPPRARAAAAPAPDARPQRVAPGRSAASVVAPAAVRTGAPGTQTGVPRGKVVAHRPVRQSDVRLPDLRGGSSTVTGRPGSSGTVKVDRNGIAPQHGSARLLYGSPDKGPYGHLPDPSSAGPGKAFTKRQKPEIRDTNRLRNWFEPRDDHTGRPLVEVGRHRRGVRPPDNEAHVDHVQPRSRGGSNSYANAEVRAREDNLKKGNRPPAP